MPFSIHSVYRQIFKVWRANRFSLFAEALSPSRNDSLIDVGGYPGYWTSLPPLVARIDSLNLDDVKYDPSTFPQHNIRVLVGNGCHLEFPDGSYDIAHSNSVIEHVGSWDNQKRFARELRRVGRRLWCQTPARECPIEPHYLAPFVHWLPKWCQRRVLRFFTPWGLISRPTRKQVEDMVEATRLISKREMAELFPDCDIHVEYLLPLIPKSYTAIRSGD